MSSTASQHSVDAQQPFRSSAKTACAPSCYRTFASPIDFAFYVSDSGAPRHSAGGNNNKLSPGATADAAGSFWSRLFS